MKAFFFILLCVVFLSCSDSNTNSSTTEATTASTLPTETIEIAPDTKRSDFEASPLAAKFKSFQDAYGALYDKVAYASLIDDQFYFYVIKGDVTGSIWGQDKKNSKPTGFKIGLVNEKNEVIIPLEFNKIYNMGGVASNLIEVELNGKLGAYDIKGNELLKAEYDGIYPYKGAAEIWVQVRKDDKFGWLSRNGQISFDQNAHQDKNLFQAQTTTALIQNWQFDSESEIYHPIFQIFEKGHPDEPTEGSGLIVTPSYLFRLGVVPEYQSNWLYDGGDIGVENFGLESSSAKIEQSQDIGGGFSALTATFQESFLDARGYQNKSKEVVTINNKMEKMDQLSLDFNLDIQACQNDINFKFIGNNLLEVCRAEKSDYNPYDRVMTSYSYYNIAPNGKISPSDIKGDFKFTRATKIDKSYFTGCFARDLSSEEQEAVRTEDEYYTYVTTNHLSIEDLDIMRNEIFATHGYRFKNKEWQNYFNSKPWYKAQFDNVDDQLSEIEKHNIQVILDLKKEMTGKEATFIKKDYGMFIAAG